MSLLSGLAVEGGGGGSRDPPISCGRTFLHVVQPQCHAGLSVSAVVDDPQRERLYAVL